MLMTRSSGRTHIGRRSNNEDAYLVSSTLRLFAVADGLGGYEGGEIASSLAIRTMRDFYARQVADPDATWPGAVSAGLTAGEGLIACAIRRANDRVVAERAGHYHRMGSTIATLALIDDQAVVAHVGDSRVYRLRHGALRRLTRDHTVGARGPRGGTSAPDPRLAHVVTRALGMPHVEPELRSDPARSGDRFLICSDGLIEVLDDDDIASVLSGGGPREASRRLVDRAFGAGGTDNITCVVVDTS